MLLSLAFLQQVIVKQSKKMAKIANIDNDNLLNDLLNFNEIFRENVTSDNIKSHQKSGLQTISGKHNFGKTTREWVKLTTPAF